MSPTQIIAVCVRLFAIWLFLFALSSLTGSYIEATKHNSIQSLSPIAWAFGGIAGICGLLWLFPLFVSRNILPDTSSSPVQKATLDTWFSLGCSLIGIWVLAKAIPALASYLMINYLGQKIYPGTFAVNQNWPLLVTFNSLHVAFGIWLFLGAKGLKKVLDWARHA